MLLNLNPMLVSLLEAGVEVTMFMDASKQFGSI